MEQQSQPVTDPRYHTGRIRRELLDLAEPARDDVKQVSELAWQPS